MFMLLVLFYHKGLVCVGVYMVDNTPKTVVQNKHEATTTNLNIKA
jgi:hypothetical protein